MCARWLRGRFLRPRQSKISAIRPPLERSENGPRACTAWYMDLYLLVRRAGAVANRSWRWVGHTCCCAEGSWDSSPGTCLASCSPRPAPPAPRRPRRRAQPCALPSNRKPPPRPFLRFSRSVPRKWTRAGWRASNPQQARTARPPPHGPRPPTGAPRARLQALRRAPMPTATQPPGRSAPMRLARSRTVRAGTRKPLQDPPGSTR